jgi:virulence-associated protein VapD
MEDTKMNYIHSALESIQFQKTYLFNDLVTTVKALRALDKSISDKAFYYTKEMTDITDVIKKHTNLTFRVIDGRSLHVLVPRLSQTIFDNSHYLKWLEEVNNKEIDLSGDLRRVLAALKTDSIEGSVNLKESRVDGVFAKVLCHLGLPRKLINYGTISDEELAAGILHEVGHVFTTFEYLSRTATTNQALGIMLKTMDGTDSFSDRKIVFTACRDKLKLSEDAYKLIENEKDKDKVTMVVYNDRITHAKSELGFSVYDSVSCEYLADQFAARHGAGKHSVTLLDKLISADMPNESSSYFTVLLGTTAVVCASFAVLGSVVTVLLILVSLVYTVNKGVDDSISNTYLDLHDVYDNDYIRMSRIKHQLVQRLKESNVDKEERQTIVNYIEEIEPVIKKYVNKDNLKLRNKVAFFFRPGYKRAYEYTVLQKELEALGNNDLYVMSEKLKLI